MGKTSQTFYIDNHTLRAYIHDDLMVISASNIEFFNMNIFQLTKLFDEIEVFDNGNIILKNHLGQFVELN